MYLLISSNRQYTPYSPPAIIHMTTEEAVFVLLGWNQEAPQGAPCFLWNWYLSDFDDLYNKLKCEGSSTEEILYTLSKKILPSKLWQTGGNVLSLWLLISINTGKSFHHISIESLLRQSTPQGTVITLPVIDCQRVGVITFIASTPCDEGSSVNLTWDCIRTLPRGGI